MSRLHVSNRNMAIMGLILCESYARALVLGFIVHKLVNENMTKEKLSVRLRLLLLLLMKK